MITVTIPAGVLKAVLQKDRARLRRESEALQLEIERRRLKKLMRATSRRKGE